MESANDNRGGLSEPRTVLVVEDHDAFRGIVCTALRCYLPGWQVVEASCVADARAVAGKAKVHVVASDMSLPDGTAGDLADSLVNTPQFEGMRMVVFSNYSGEDLKPLLQRGVVHAFVPKDQGVKALAEAIQQQSTP